MERGGVSGGLPSNLASAASQGGLLQICKWSKPRLQLAPPCAWAVARGTQPGVLLRRAQALMLLSVIPTGPAAAA